VIATVRSASKDAEHSDATFAESIPGTSSALRMAPTSPTRQRGSEERRDEEFESREERQTSLAIRSRAAR